MIDFTSLGTWSTLYLVSEWVIRVTMLGVVPFRRSPQSAQAWLLLILFLPWIGLLVFLTFGHNIYPRWRRDRYARLPDAFGRLRDRLAQSPPVAAPPLPPHLAHIVKLVQNLGQLPILGGNHAAFIPGYDRFLRRLVEDIDAAQHHVHLLFYIFSDDASAQPVIDALKRAQARGVACRVLIDALGSRAWARSLRRQLEPAGVQLHEVLPLGLFNWRAARIDLRNHRKVVVIDGVVGYVGSQNIVDKIYKPGIVYEELMARVTGPVVLELQFVFAGDWFIETEEVLDSPELFPPPRRHDRDHTAVAQVLPTGPGFENTGLHQLIVALVHGARERVCITTPYFIPDDTLLQALDTAVRRGVDVTLIVPRDSDQILVGLAQRSYYGELLRMGVRIVRYRERFLHAKHLSIDGAITLIGSSNLDIRSFQLNAEVTLLAYDPPTTQRLRLEQDRYFAGGDVLTLDEWSARPRPRKLLENLARLLSSLL